MPKACWPPSTSTFPYACASHHAYAYLISTLTTLPPLSTQVPASPSGLKPPFFQGNEHEASGVCAIGQVRAGGETPGSPAKVLGRRQAVHSAGGRASASFPHVPTHMHAHQPSRSK